MTKHSSLRSIFFLTPKSTNPGFTLIELLIVISIMVLLVGGGIAAFVTFQRNQTILSIAKDAQQYLQTAQVKARVKETPTTCTTAASRLQGYRVNFNSDYTWQINPLCGPDGGAKTEQLRISTFTADSAVATLTRNASNGLVYQMDFYTLGSGTNLEKPMVFNFSAPGTDTGYCFKVETSGVIGTITDWTNGFCPLSLN